MGWLERWDRRNQRIMEWHQHVDDEERRGARPSRPSWKAALAIGVGWVLLELLQPVLYDVVGVALTIGIMFAIAAVLLWLAIDGRRRERRAWEASRRDPAMAGRPDRSDATEAVSSSQVTQPPPEERRSA